MQEKIKNIITQYVSINPDELTPEVAVIFLLSLH